MRMLQTFKQVIWRQLFITLAMVGWLGAAHTAAAQTPEQSAHDFAEDVKNELVAVIQQKEELEQEGGQDNYIEAVKQVLLPVVDFDYIARGVMGRYGREATSEQREQFAEKFQRSLINTYAKGLAGYGDYEISVVPPKEDMSGKRTVSVWMNVSNGDDTHRLAFTTKLNREGNWKVTNMILNGVNLGKAFRGQFDSAVKQNDGDIGAAIEGWEV